MMQNAVLSFRCVSIGDITEMDEIGYEDYIYGEGVSLIEWANLIEEILRKNGSRFRLKKIWNRDSIIEKLQ